jgi:hypothetical protein
MRPVPCGRRRSVVGLPREASIAGAVAWEWAARNDPASGVAWLDEGLGERLCHRGPLTPTAVVLASAAEAVCPTERRDCPSDHSACSTDEVAVRRLARALRARGKEGRE